ncbi:hypothetical protein GN958_ATG15409 [Phytophthora infestans]|uniref:Uncharacterized protein n=1 Tax=Phytophthora infestans TaxID=4787 RepID=A0A8S9U7I0_PHYIN|nr:hypothetical protein GN958_ATG15409 [Phytophthora infestans]
MELDFGGQVTNYECVVEKSTNVENAGDSVTNSDTNSEGVGGRTIDLPLSVDDPEDEVAPLTLSAGKHATSSYAVGSSVTNSVKDALDTITMAPRSTRRRLSLGFDTKRDADKNLIVKLNPASNPAGRPKEPRATKKVKARKGIEETKVLAHQLTSLGDITLATLREYAHMKRLSLSAIEPVF